MSAHITHQSKSKKGKKLSNPFTYKLFRDYKHLAKLFYSGQTFIAFDTETTGLKASENYVIEIGAVKFNYSRLVGKPFDLLIKPPCPIHPSLTELTHISEDMLKDCPSAKEAMPLFLNYIESKDAILLAHNAPFDLAFVDTELSRSGINELQNLTVDTLPLARWAWPGLAQLEEKGQYKLQSLAKRFNVNVLSAHRAHDDARVCMEIFKKIIEDTMNKQKDFSLPSQNQVKASDQLSLF